MESSREGKVELRKVVNVALYLPPAIVHILAMNSRLLLFVRSPLTVTQ